MYNDDEDKRIIKKLDSALGWFRTTSIIMFLSGVVLLLVILYSIFNIEVNTKPESWRADYYSEEDMLEVLENESARNAE